MLVGVEVEEKVEERTDPMLSISDPAIAEFLGIGHTNDSGILLTELSSLELSAVWRSVLLISGTIAGFPLNTYRRGAGDERNRIDSFLDDPDPDKTPFEWMELIVAHELLWGNSFLHNVFGGAGQLMGLTPLPPWTVGLRRSLESGEKLFTVRDITNKTRELTSIDITHIPSFSLDGTRGVSPIGMARHSLGAARSGDKAAGRMFRNGLMLGGILSPKTDALTKTQRTQVLDGLRESAGTDHTGDVAFIPAAVNFSPWMMNANDAQFLESRHFGIEECSRWFGVPRELLSESGASSWGSGIQEIVRGFSRFCLMGYTTRIQQRLSRLLPKNQFCEFDYSTYLKPSPEDEIRLLIEQVQARILTIDEARAKRNMGPYPGGAPDPTPTQLNQQIGATGNGQ